MAKVFLDCGTHLGQGLKSIVKKEKITPDWKIYSWEANPYTFEERQYFKKYRFDEHNITYFNAAVSTENKTIPLLVQHKKEKHSSKINTGQGSTIVSTDSLKENLGKMQANEFINVECIDLDEWITNNTTDNDSIIIKFDIEGEEYDVLEKLMYSSNIKKIKKIYVEWHGHHMKQADEYAERQKIIEEKLKESNVVVIGWH